jgi:hypothetical protein
MRWQSNIIRANLNIKLVLNHRGKFELDTLFNRIISNLTWCEMQKESMYEIFIYIKRYEKTYTILPLNLSSKVIAPWDHDPRKFPHNIEQELTFMYLYSIARGQNMWWYNRKKINYKFSFQQSVFITPSYSSLFFVYLLTYTAQFYFNELQLRLRSQHSQNLTERQTY